MNLLDDSLAPRTRFDWNFHIGDIPVRVHPFFWLTTVLLSRPDKEQFLPFLLAWVVIVFVSILVHELGHVLMGRLFGSRGEIVLTGLCGLAIGSNHLSERWQRILVSLAGPGAGFLLGGVVYFVFWMLYPEYSIAWLQLLVGIRPELVAGAFPSLIAANIFGNLMYVNLFWGLVNLLPIWPLDGGQVCRELCEAKKGPDGMRLSIQISLITALAFAVLELVEFIRIEELKRLPLIPYVPLAPSLFTILFFAFLAFNSWRVLQFIRRGGMYEEQDQSPRAPWERDADWWKKGDGGWRD